MKFLGANIREPVEHLETIPLEESAQVKTITFAVTEFTARCPVTKQPDYYHIEIEIEPNLCSIESKSLKLWLWKYRDMGVFCETLSAEILKEVFDIVQPHTASVTVSQASRGGIQIKAKASKDASDATI